MFKKYDKFLKDEQWLRQKYWLEGLCCLQIAKIVGCGDATIWRALKSFGIPTRSYKELKDKEWLYQKYWIEEKSTIDIANLLGCSKDGVWYAMNNANIPRRTMAEVRARQPRICKYEILGDKDWLYQKYIVEKQSSCKIANIVGCSDGAVCRALNKFGICRRSHAEARKYVKIPKHHTTIECIYWGISKMNDINSEFTGDSSFWIGRLNPDFIIRDNRIAIFINGDYWHSPLLRYNMGETQRVDFQVKTCKKNRWKAVIIWESDLRREDAEQFVLSELKKAGVALD